jgi:hypothetical protein
MQTPVNRRIGWPDLPTRVRDAVQEILGDRVVSAVSQPGGFSPGTADRVVTAGGRRAFVKAVGAALNDRSVVLHRREGEHTAALPPQAPTPRLLGRYDDGDWVALVLTDVAGRHPVTPWRADELERVLATLADLAALLTPAPAVAVPTAADLLRDDFRGWRRIAGDPPADLDPWARDHLDDLVHAAGAGHAALAGDTLCHADLRSDNLLLGREGAVTVVDWPWACRGPAWLDTVLLLLNVEVHGGWDSEALLRSTPLAAEAAPAVVTGVFAGFAGFFLDAARQPPPPGIPTVRAFQRAQADALLPWLARRFTGGYGAGG